MSNIRISQPRCQISALKELQKIRRKVYWTGVCLEAGTRYSGTAIEDIIDPGYYEAYGYYKNNLRRIAAGANSPNNTTLDIIEGKIKSTKFIFNLLLWEAMNTNIDESEKRKEFYKRLPIKFQKHIFSQHSVNIEEFTRRKITSPEIDKIHKEGSLNALACLTGLLVDVKTEHWCDYGQLETAVFNLLLVHFQLPIFQRFRCDIFKYYSEHIITKERAIIVYSIQELRWAYSKIELSNEIARDSKLISIAKQLGFVHSFEDSKLFLFWFYKLGQKPLIEQLLSLINNNLLENYKELNMLIKKLNIARPLAKKITKQF